MTDRAPTRTAFRRASLVAVTALVLAIAVGAPRARADQQELFAQGYELYKSGLYRGAIALFEQGLATEPNNGLAHYYIAESHYKLGAYQPALDHYRVAVAFLPPGAEASKANNMIVAIQAEFDAASATSELPEPAPSQSATTEPSQTQAATTSGPTDWNAVTADSRALARAIADFYDATQPAAEAKGSTIINVFSIALDSTLGDRAVVKFRCEVRAAHGKTGIFRARVTLVAEAGSYRVVEFKQDERFDIVKGFSY
ncbi:MAG: tetratricopeptide repeat protein [Alphaproteobacteria bacterium]